VFLYIVNDNSTGLLVWVRTEVIDAPDNDNIRGAYLQQRVYLN
jgi:hypothetical protein